MMTYEDLKHAARERNLVIWGNGGMEQLMLINPEVCTPAYRKMIEVGAEVFARAPEGLVGKRRYIRPIFPRFRDGTFILHFDCRPAQLEEIRLEYFIPVQILAARR